MTMPLVYNRNKDSDIPRSAVYIGRGSKWGNPYEIDTKTGDTRLVVIEKYKRYFWESSLPNDIEELEGKDLVCYCKPLPCHGDYLVKLANSKSFFMQEQYDYKGGE